MGYDEELALGVDVLKLIKHINGLFFFVKNRLVYFLTSFSLTALLLLAPVKMKQKNCISRSHLHAVTAKANTDSVNKQLNLFTKKKKKKTPPKSLMLQMICSIMKIDGMYKLLNHRL